MKKSLLITSALIIISCVGAKNSNYRDQLIGSWEFVQTQDLNGNKLERYEGSFGTVNAIGPKLIYNKDSTYNKVFTPKNTDKGKWRFNEKTMTIEHDLFIDSTTWVGQDLIKRGLAEKKKDGNYYELIEDKVLKIEDGKIYIDNRGLIDVFKKVK